MWGHWLTVDGDDPAPAQVPPNPHQGPDIEGLWMGAVSPLHNETLGKINSSTSTNHILT